MRAAAALIVDMIPELSSPDDPGRTLDALPRTLDAKDEPAAPLVQEMWALLVGAAIVPNGTGTLCPAESLSLHPIDDHALAEQWLALVKDEDSLTGVVHPSCLKRQRIPRLKELRTRSKQQLKQLNTCRWLEAACAATVADCKACLLLVAELNKSQPWQFNGEGIRAAKIVLADTGKLVAAQEAVIDGATDRIRGFYQVEPLLLADGLLRKVLIELFSIKSLDNEEWERRIRRSVANTRGHYGGTELLAWEAVWALLRSAPSAVLEKITNLYDQIKIRCLDNGWRYRHEVLLPGRIVSTDEQEGAAAGLTIAQTHGADAHVFAAMGVSDVPRKVLQAFPGSSAPHGFVKAMRELYWPHLSRRQNPHASLIGIINYFTRLRGGCCWRKLQVSCALA